MNMSGILYVQCTSLLHKQAWGQTGVSLSLGKCMPLGSESGHVHRVTGVLLWLRQIGVNPEKKILSGRALHSSISIGSDHADIGLVNHQGPTMQRQGWWITLEVGHWALGHGCPFHSRAVNSLSLWRRVLGTLEGDTQVPPGTSRILTSPIFNLSPLWMKWGPYVGTLQNPRTHSLRTQDEYPSEKLVTFFFLCRGLHISDVWNSWLLTKVYDRLRLLYSGFHLNTPLDILFFVYV